MQYRVQLHAKVTQNEFFAGYWEDDDAMACIEVLENDTKYVDLEGSEDSKTCVGRR